MKRYFICFVLILLPCFAIAQPAGYEYSPSSKAEPDSAGLAIAIGKVEYKSGKENLWSSSPELKSLDQAIKNDLAKILKAKGVGVKGPFSSDKIPKSEKKSTDLLLKSTIEISGKSEPVYRFNDIKVELKGKFILTLEDVATREIIWSSNVPLPFIAKFDYNDPSFWKKVYSITWDNPMTADKIDDEKILKSIQSVNLMPPILDDFAQGMEKQYPEMMASIEKMLDPQEIKTFKNQAQEPAQADVLQNKVEPYVASFAYTPSVQKSSSAQGISFAVAKVIPSPSEAPDILWKNELSNIKMIDQNSGKMLWYSFAQFTNMGTKLRKNIAELLFARGFAVKGPFENYEAISAADKKTVDLYIIPKIEATFSVNEIKMAKSQVTQVDVSTKVMIELRDIKTFSVLWTKETDPLNTKFNYKSTTSYDVNNKYNYIMNETVRGIEQKYSELMNNVSKLIDPQEMRSFKTKEQGKTGY